MTNVPKIIDTTSREPERDRSLFVMNGLRTAIGLLTVWIAIVTSGCCELRKSTNYPCKKGQKSTLHEINALPFMGGSLSFNSSDQALSHLSAGMTIPIRLGQLAQVSIDPSKLPQEVQDKLAISPTTLYDYVDVKSSATFGVLEIASISTSEIEMKVKLFDGQDQSTSSVVKLEALQQIDINGDSNPDLEYVPEIGASRTAAPGQMYLRFLSSKSVLTTTMFSLSQSRHGPWKSPSGILAFNVDGRAIIRLDASASTSRTRLRSLEQVVPGDFILDVDNGGYIRVSEPAASRIRQSGRLGAPKSDSLTSTDAETASLMEALPVFFMSSASERPQLQRSLARSPSSRVLDNKAEYDARVKHWSNVLAGYSSHKSFSVPKGIAEKLAGCQAGTCIGVQNIVATIAVEANVSISWSHVSGDIAAAFMLEGFAGASSSQTARIEGKDHPLSPQFDLGTTFVYGPLIIDVGVKPSVGYNAEAWLGANTRLGVDFCAVWGGSANIDIGWSDQTGSPGAKFEDAFIHPQMDLSTTLQAHAHIKPYINLTPYVTLEKVLFVRIPIKFALGPTWDVTAVTEKGTVDVRAAVEAEIDVKLTAGAGISLFDIYEEWTPVDVGLFNWHESIWEKQMTVAVYKDEEGSDAVGFYPDSVCELPRVVGEGGVCVEPKQCEKCDTPHDRALSFHLKAPAVDKTVTLRWIVRYKGDRVDDSEGEIVRSKVYSLSAQSGCLIDRRPCVEIVETFFDLKPGPWEISLWSDDASVMWQSMQVTISSGVWTVVKCKRGGSCEVFEHTPSAPPN